MRNIFIIMIATALYGCENNKTADSREVNNIRIGIIERLDSSIYDIIEPGAQAEIISEGYQWSEGPLWIESENMLLFSDVPTDTVYKWTEENRREVYLTPSGYTGDESRGGEMGSNGLLLDNEGRLVLCQHGDRRLARMDARLADPAPKYVTLADNYNGKRFNSPNDAVYNKKGELFFTDPPFGLENRMQDPRKEIPFQGVYRVKKNGKVELVTDSITRPNGIAFFPGERTMLVANSDPAKPHWYAFDLGDDDRFRNGRIFLSADDNAGNKGGLPDGLKIDSKGNVFATGPGGVWIFDSAGKILGRIKLPDPASNCALTTDEKTLFITNDMYVLRLVMRK